MRILKSALKATLYTLLAITLFSCNNGTIKHEWTPTFDNDSYEPFGCILMDSIFSSLLKEDSLDYSTTNFINQKETLRKEGNQLWIDMDNIQLDNEMVEIMRNKLERGYSTIFVSESFNGQIETTTDRFYFYRFQEEVNKTGKYENSVIMNEKTGKTYNFPKQLCIRHFQKEATMTESYMERQVIASIDGEPIAILFKHPNGASILLISTPLLFTNYGLLHENNAELLVDLINQAGIEDGLTRVFYKQKNIQAQIYESGIDPESKSTSSDMSFMKELFKALSIKIAIILGILIFILFLLFSSKRRQRMIPVVQPPHNKTLDFILQISKLYFWKKDYNNMTRKKITYFISFINERLHIRLDNESLLTQNAEIIASATNLKKDKIESLLKTLLNIHTLKQNVTGQDMIRYINQMNQISKKLK